MLNSPLGSLWRRWDLHFHTPASYDYQDLSVTNTQIVDGLLSAGVGVVAITDHHVIDVERISELRAAARDRLTILPGIELRSELGAKPIHYIGIFPESSDLSHLWDTIRGALGLTPQGIREKGGNDGIYIQIEKAHSVFTGLGGLTSLHAGAKSNSIETISNKEQFQQRIKLDVTRKFVDLLEIGQIKDVPRYRGIIFPATGLDLPLIVGSDNHNVRTYSPPVACWLKADPTFLGLRQVVNEPSERVYLGTQPPELERVDSNRTRYVQSLSISKKSESSLGEKWFGGVTLDLNPGMVTIIGNKGSGKSALTDILGLLGNSPHQDTFSFLHPEQFRHPRGNKAREFDASLTWRSGASIRRNLAEEIDPSAVETIKYIPQRHLEAICDELKGGREGRFERELKEVIFSRVPRKNRMNLETLDQLIGFRTKELQASIQLVGKEVAETNAAVVDLEERATPGYRAGLEAKLGELDRELDAHRRSKPTTIPKPNADPTMERRIEQLTREIEELAARIDELDGTIELRQKSVETASRRLSLAEKVRRGLKNLQQEFGSALERISGECAELGVDPRELASLRVDTSRLDEIEEQARGERGQAEEDLDEKNEDSATANRLAAKERILELREELDRPNQQYQEYLERVALWKRKEDSIVGDEGAPDTIKYLSARIQELGVVPQQLAEARERQVGAALAVFGEKLRLVHEYEALYAPVQDFIDTHPLARDRFGLQFRVSMVARDFEDRFLAFINQNRIGSFRGDQGSRRIHQLVAEADFDSEEGVRVFITKVLDQLRHDRRVEQPDEVLVSDQLNRGFSPLDLYEYVLGLEYVQPRFVLRWEKKPLEQLSPGERGTLLLVFFLLIDDSKVPLIIDQPEGNLDNQTVYELLVDCIREAKSKRQIIIVTHNPNLAVVCDAEQVIYASLDKEHGCRVRYTSGALENPEICKKIVDVLEGTKPAIDKRVAKYNIIFEGNSGSL